MFNVQVVDLGCIYREEGALFLFPAADGSVPTGHFLDAPTQPAALRCGVPSWYLRLLQRQNSLKEQSYSIPYTAHSVSVGLYFVNWPFLVLANECNLPYPKYLQGGSSDRFLSPFGRSLPFLSSFLVVWWEMFRFALQLLSLHWCVPRDPCSAGMILRA